MDISGSFTISLNQFWTNKKIITPLIIPSAVFLIFASFFIAWTGIYTDISSYKISYDDYLSKNPEDITGDKFEPPFDLSAVFSEKLFNFETIIMFIVFVLIFAIVSFYCSVLSSSASFILAKKKNLDWKMAFSYANSKFFTIANMYLIEIALFIVFMIIAVILGILIYLTNAWLGNVLAILLVVLFSIAALAVIAIFFIRLIFSEPIIFFSNLSAKKSIVESYNTTKGRLKWAFIICVIISVIPMIFSFGSNSAVDTSISNIFSNSSAKLIFGLLIFCFLTLIGVIAKSFVKLFLMNAYLEFRKR